MDEAVYPWPKFRFRVDLVVYFPTFHIFMLPAKNYSYTCYTSIQNIIVWYKIN